MNLSIIILMDILLYPILRAAHARSQMGGGWPYPPPTPNNDRVGSK